MSKFNRKEIDAVITNFTLAAHKKYENHTYSSGYLSTLLALALERVPGEAQEIILKQLLEQAHALYNTAEAAV